MIGQPVRLLKATHPAVGACSGGSTFTYARIEMAGALDEILDLLHAVFRLPAFRTKTRRQRGMKPTLPNGANTVPCV
jgi:hypothetical protein